MPYVAQRSLTALGVHYAPGDVVPADGLDRRALEASLHLGRLKYVDRETLDAAPARQAAPKAAPKTTPVSVAAKPAAPARAPRRVAHPAVALGG